MTENAPDPVMNNAFMLLILMTLTVFRITWFITEDTFPPMRWFRDKIVDRSTTKGKWERNIAGESVWRDTWSAELITCPWCVSVWVAAALTLGVELTLDLEYPWLWFGAVAGLAPIITMGVNKLREE